MTFCICRALRDADKAISLSPNLAKGHFRRGKAQMGMQKFREAADSFNMVLAIDPQCEEAMAELHYVRVYEIMVRSPTLLESCLFSS